MTPGPPQALVGEPGHAIKISGIHRKDRIYTVDFESVPAAASGSDVRTAWRLQDGQGATFQTLAPELYRFVVAAAATQPSHQFQRGKASMRIATGH
jgi:hypothetical protein